MKMLRIAFVFVLFLIVGQSIAQPNNRDDVGMFVKENSTRQVINSFTTMDGQYRADVSMYDCISIDDEQTTTASVDILEIIDQQTDEVIFQTEQIVYCGGLGTYGYDLIGWINDDLYYTQDREGEVHGNAYAWFSTMYRISLDNLVEENLSKSIFSPIRIYRVAWDFDGTVIEIITLATGDTISTALQEALIITDVVWLPDESGLIVVQGDTGMPLSNVSVVTYISVDGSTSEIIHDSRNE